MASTTLPAGAPKRYQGDAHAVVAMLFRKRHGARELALPQLRVEEEERDVPPPVQIVPANQLIEDSDAERQQVEEERISYTAQYWNELKDLLIDCEVFFILRATNKRDRWSGQVGLPGGRKKKGETDLEAAARETFEEVGLQLPFLPPHLVRSAAATDGGPAFKYLGRLNDRAISQNNRRLVVSCLLYLQTVDVTPSLTLAPSEVAACGWAPFQHFATPNCASAMKVNLKGSFLGRKRAGLAKMIQIAGVSSFTFIRVLLPLTEMHTPDPITDPTERETVLKQFSLWGLTLGMISETLLSTGIRQRPFELKSNILNQIEFDRVFDSKVHNLALHIWRTAIEFILQQPLTWEQKITSYMALVGAGVPISLALTTIATVNYFKGAGSPPSRL